MCTGLYRLFFFSFWILFLWKKKIRVIRNIFRSLFWGISAKYKYWDIILSFQVQSLYIYQKFVKFPICSFLLPIQAVWCCVKPGGHLQVKPPSVLTQRNWQLCCLVWHSSRSEMKEKSRKIRAMLSDYLFSWSHRRCVCSIMSILSKFLLEAL